MISQCYLSTKVCFHKAAQIQLLANCDAGQLSKSCKWKGFSFTQKNTLSDSKTMRTIKQAQDNGYHIRMYYIGLGSVEESIERIANCHRKGGHTIPEEMCAGDIRNVLTACLTLCRFAMRFFSMIMRTVLWKSVDTAAGKCPGVA